MSERLAVIGCNSFSGSHFLRHALEHGYDVLGISRSAEPPAAFWPLTWPGSEPVRARFRFVQADLNDDLSGAGAALTVFRPQIVVNFAALGMVAESWQYPVDYYRTNIVAQVALHDVLRRLPDLRRYVHVSTPEVYGRTEGEIDETAPVNPSTPYAASRAACDLHLATYWQEYGFPVVWTRAANVFGPGQQLYRIVPRTLLALRLGRRLPLHGGGSSRRSFIHVRDVCRATLDIARRASSGERFHISTPHAMSVRDLVRTMCDMAGGEFDRLVDVAPERPGKDPAYRLNSDKLRRVLGWQEEIGLVDGLRDALGWIDRNLSTLKDLPVEYVHRR
jgi:dTDP-glucose 4,6-dehydratase